MALPIGRFILLCLILASVSRADDRYVDVIDPSVTYQTIDHFAASDCWSMQRIGTWQDAHRQRIAELLFSTEKGIGLSAWRFNLGAGIETTRIRNRMRTMETFETAEGKYDWTRCAATRFFLAAAKGYGVRNFIAFCNSPPLRLTRNKLSCTDADTKITSNLAPGMEHAFGRYLADILVHFRDNPDLPQRIRFNWVSPLNEPQWDWTANQEGTRNSNADIIRQYTAIADELHRQHLDVHILGPESGSIPDMYHVNSAASGKYHAPFGDYVDLLCRNNALAGVMDHTIGYHSYWSDGVGQFRTDRTQLKNKLDQFPDWRVFETEYCVMQPGRDLTMTTALRAMQILQADLTIANASGWSWWLAVSNGNYKDGLIYTDWHRPGDTETILPSKWFWAYGNYSRFVRPGMVRIAIRTQAAPHDLATVFATAWRDPAAGRLVVIYTNATNQAVPVKLSNTTGRSISWQSYVTSDAPDDNLRPAGRIGPGAPITVPARAVVTLVETGRNG